MLAAAELHRLALEGATLLAPNLRVARQVRTRIGSEIAGGGGTPQLDRVTHWRAWTADLWQTAVLEGREERVLLLPLQERLLWEQILDSDPAVERTDALTELCLSAVALVYQHNASAALLAERGSPGDGDIGRFAHWFRSFQEHCRAEALLPSAALESALTALTTHAPHGPDTLVLCDLAGLSPAQQGLLVALRKQGTQVVAVPQQSAGTPRLTLLRCDDQADELRCLARHVSAALTSAQRPDIAVIVPDLSASRDRIERVLREHLPAHPESAFAEDHHPLWDFSTGRPLAATGVVADALHLLAWTVRELEPGELSLLLRSPHFDWPVDAAAAASLDAALIRRSPNLRGTWSSRAVAHLLERSSPVLAEALLQRTRSWAGLHGSTGSFTALAERSRRILQDFGWFHSRHRSSADFQAVSRFETLLDSLGGLDLVGGDAPTWTGFLQRLTSTARSTSFARENTGAPIQFLTPDESTGYHAAETWVLHADEDRWSSRATPHPLLARGLQLRHGMPGTEPALDQLRFREQVDRIAGTAPGVTFSYAHIGDSGEQRPSPAVLALPSLEQRTAESPGTLAALHASAALQSFEDGPLIPLALDGNPIAGGVSTLQSQAACAFRAFAERRLGSTTLNTTDLGLDARDRGSLLHHALQLFWNDTRDSKALRELIRTDGLSTAIHHAVEGALRTRRGPADPWSESYLQIQRIRLESLLHRWLRIEADRPDFTVAALERDLTVTVGELALKVRIDRVDQVTLPDGSTSHVFLDYKTGLQNARKWEGDRPDEPQLPLYATAAMPHLSPAVESAVGAIAFAVIRPGDSLEFVSAPKKSAWLSRDPKASTTTLDTALDHWRDTLQTLAEDFAAGIAAVGPKEYPATCRFCEQRLLCRLNPALLDAEEGEPEA